MSKEQQRELAKRELARLEADFGARAKDDRPMPACVAKAYAKVMEQQRRTVNDNRT